MSDWLNVRRQHFTEALSRFLLTLLGSTTALVVFAVLFTVLSLAVIISTIPLALGR